MLIRALYLKCGLFKVQKITPWLRRKHGFIEKVDAGANNWTLRNLFPLKLGNELLYLIFFLLPATRSAVFYPLVMKSVLRPKLGNRKYCFLFHFPLVKSLNEFLVAACIVVHHCGSAGDTGNTRWKLLAHMELAF